MGESIKIYHYKFNTTNYGILYEFKGITKFCKEHNLTQSKISQVINGKITQHKGWKNAS
jgi:hypothetical protein